MNKGLLVNYRWCTGCHSCELACQVAKGLPAGQFGIKLNQVGPWEYGDGQWQYSYIPVLTDQCDLCAERVQGGKLPSCVQHCQANCIQVMCADEAAKLVAEHPKTMFMVP